MMIQKIKDVFTDYKELCIDPQVEWIKKHKAAYASMIIAVLALEFSLLYLDNNRPKFEFKVPFEYLPGIWWYGVNFEEIRA